MGKREKGGERERERDLKMLLTVDGGEGLLMRIFEFSNFFSRSALVRFLFYFLI